MSYDLCIIGAGAAGLMCAITAAKRGKRVLILEHNDQLGKKIRISGGGRCNFTNLHTDASHYLCQNPHFVKSALAGYSPYDFIDFITQAGIEYHERDHGQLFCNDSAQQIIDLFAKQCQQLGVEIQLQCHIDAVRYHDPHFEIKSHQGSFHSHALVIATGGLSLPKIGASPFGHRIAKQFDIPCVETAAALVPLTFTGKEKLALEQLAGIAIPIAVHYKNHNFCEAMLFTHRGLSGPAILQISSYWQPGDFITIDLLPGQNLQDNLEQLRDSKQHLHNYLATLLPKRLINLFISMGHIPEQMELRQLSHPSIIKISQQMHGWQLKPSGTEGYRTAEATRGGVDTHHLSSKTMASKHHPNLYFIGEVVDVTGHLGGFNFQWAWSSGYAAGSYC
ncbi:MAG: NAD(P)/FAD-dependent oxidoreductase [Zetaproteobacteria bacterium]|nr:NAD(P)/FAD-dependent oxidoreductase [Zetaproteobacteria bacterium]